jgi:pyruvate/2-oxoglutarate dehydrogenase complex dihydrolipoamide acyltransferase (E2) component
LILALSLPKLGEQLVGAAVHRVLVEPGQPLRPGTPVMEVRADLGARGQQDCPPTQYFRIVATEKAFLKRVLVSVGENLAPGASLVVATTAEDESSDGAPARALRSMTVGIRVDPLSE